MITSEERLKQIIKYEDQPAPLASLKPGFNFAYQDYTRLESLKKTEDTISLMENNVVMRDIVLKNKETDLVLYFIVSSSSCKEAREQTISWAAGMTSMPIDVFSSGPPDIGEFSVVLSGNIDMVHFVRNNIGVTVFLREGKLDVAGLAKQIDQKIQSMRDFTQNEIKSLLPPISGIIVSDKKYSLNKQFILTVYIDNKYSSNNLQYFFEYDDDMLNLEEEDGSKAVFKTLMPGKTFITCVVVDKINLLSSSESIEINIEE